MTCKLIRSTMKQLGMGRLLYRTFYAPRASFQRFLSRGIKNTILDSFGQRQMLQFAERLSPLPLTPIPDKEVCFLTGSNHWYQTCLCAYSLLSHSSLPLRIRLFDDGTLTLPQQEFLKFLFPFLTIVSAEEANDILATHLPANRYPSLFTRRKEYPHIKKLLDTHCSHSGWRLVLDSDMLFFDDPVELLDWIHHPTAPIHMIDCMTSYGYSQELLKELTGCTLPEKINVGVCGLQSETIDWDKLEYWCTMQIEREGTHYVQEQALTAMLMTSTPRVALPKERYICCPSKESVLDKRGVLHHYVAESKSWYYQFAWKKAFEGNAASTPSFLK